MTTLIAVDPGKCYVGVAKFDGQTLVYADTVRSRKPWPQGAYDVAEKLRPLAPVDELVFEFPVIYPKKTRSPNDLLPLCFADGLITAVLAAKEYSAVDPARWKGTIDPDIVITRIKAALSPQEHAACRNDDHNQWDAVGIGLWKIKRLHAGR